MRFLVLAMALCACVSAGGQAASPTASDEQRIKEVHDRGIAMLHDAVEASRQLSQPANRIYVEAACIQFLWDSDEPLARSLVKSVEAHYQELSRQLGPMSRNERGFLQQAYFMRRQVIDAVAAHDAKLALEFLRDTRPPFDTGNGNQEGELEMALAMRAARENAKLAVELVRNSGAPNSGMLPSVLDQAYASDPAAATQAAAEIVQRLMAAPAGDQQAFFGATQLLQYYGNRQADGPAFVMRPGRAAQHSVVSAALLQQLASSLLAKAQKADFPPNLRQNLQNITPVLEKIVPGSPALLQLSKAAENNVGQNQFWQQLNDVAEHGTVQQGVEFAQRSPDPFRTQAYERIASKMAGDGNFSAASEFLEQAELPPEQRQQLLQNLKRNAVYQQSNRGAFEQARATASGLDDPYDRASLLVQLAQNALAQKQPAAAESLLNEARSLSPAIPSNIQDFNLLVQIANVYAGFQASQAVEVLEPLIAEANLKLPAMAVVDGFTWGQRSFISGEMALQSGAAAELVRGISNTVANMAPEHFDEAHRLAGEFQRPEARTIVYLEIARRLLSENPGNRGRRAIIVSGGSIGSAIGH